MKKIICFIFAFVLCFSFMVVPSLAYELNADTLPEARYPYERYVVVAYGSEITFLYVFGSEVESQVDNIELTYNDSTKQIRVTKGSGDDIVYGPSYKLQSDGTWKSNGFESVPLNIAFTDILYSDYDVYDTEGELFFQNPPVTMAEAIMKVVKAEMPATQTNLAQTMKTIVLCGVGCLALLISLVLLVRVLRRSLQN